MNYTGVTQRIIILEGLDRCGKSTQAKMLWKWLAKNQPYNPLVQLHYSGYPTQDQSVLNYNHMFEIIEDAPWTNFILDRSHIGEMVYAPKYRGYSGDYVLDIEERYSLKDFFLFTFIDDVDNLLARDDGDSLSSAKEDLEEEIAAFKNATLLSIIPRKLMINISGKTPEQIHDIIIENLSTN
jgi:thymidylate kinase